MSQALKKCTGLTGLAVATNPHRALTRVYDKIIRTLQKLPQDYPYRKHTEKLVTERNQIVRNTNNVEEIEKKIGCGQIEELIYQAENELNLARNMLQWKPWEPMVQKAPPKQWAWPPHQ